MRRARTGRTGRTKNRWRDFRAQGGLCCEVVLYALFTGCTHKPGLMHVASIGVVGLVSVRLCLFFVCGRSWACVECKENEDLLQPDVHLPQLAFYALHGGVVAVDSSDKQDEEKSSDRKD